jgi:uncharacterized protein Yka (UPF0111/DUF47 family)
MTFRLIPKDESFFDLFEQAAARLVTGAGILVEATERFDTIGENAKKLERTFITPIDREDIYRLVTDLDDVMDLMEAVTERFILFKVQRILPQAAEIAKVIQQQTEEINRLLPQLRRMKRDSIMPHCVEINRLENVADRLMRTAFASLFDGSYDPLTVIKWRELYEILEQATDKCEDVANTVESIVLKHA